VGKIRARKSKKHGFSVTEKTDAGDQISTLNVHVSVFFRILLANGAHKKLEGKIKRVGKENCSKGGE